MTGNLKKVFAAVAFVAGFGAGVLAHAYSVQNDEGNEVNVCMADESKKIVQPCVDLIEDLNRDMLKSGLTGGALGVAGVVIFARRRNKNDQGPK